MPQVLSRHDFVTSLPKAGQCRPEGEKRAANLAEQDRRNIRHSIARARIASGTQGRLKLNRMHNDKIARLVHGVLNTTQYGGPQLSRQKLIPRGKRKLLTAKENYSRQKKITHCKKKRLTAKRKTSRQNEKPHGKKKKTHDKKKGLAAKRKRLTAKRKRLTAKRKASRQKEKTHGKKNDTDSQQKKKGHGGWPSFSKYSMGKKQLKGG